MKQTTLQKLRRHYYGKLVVTSVSLSNTPLKWPVPSLCPIGHENSVLDFSLKPWIYLFCNVSKMFLLKSRYFIYKTKQTGQN